mmetsp:Transcript_6998/g.8831  ORF Transcript_6998/g.8831 Transcript_6998/m.8831 type:complete len:131 (+) Transcript_6998:188-580(+)
MGCPVIRNQKGEKQHVVLSSSAVALLERYKAKVGTDCGEHIQRLQECRNQVIQGNASSCVKEAESFTACSKRYHKERGEIERNCEHVLGIYHSSLRENFLHCLENHQGAEHICEKSLQEFVDCASSTMKQ